MPTEPIYVIGAGGHAKVVVDALLAAGVAFDRIAVSDNNPALEGTSMLGRSVRTPAVRTEMRDGYFHVAIGNAQVRALLHEQLIALGARPVSVVHPASIVAPSARVGEGVFIAARAIIGPDASLACAVIVNHGAVVDHDCQVGEFSHIAPNATLAGAVHVGAGVLVGAGANILPGMRIDDNAVVGAGAVVNRNVMGGHTCVGVPALSLGKGKRD